MIDHVVLLMLENRSFDSMLGTLYPAGPGFDGLTGAESNPWHHDGMTETIRVWDRDHGEAREMRIPDPDPGELFPNIGRQIFGLDAPPGSPATMTGFVDDYMRPNEPDPPGPPRVPEAVMHHFRPEQVPVLSTLARAFGVSDRWFASAPCQTWPNRFFAHTGTAGGWVDNEPVHLLYTMPSIFGRLSRHGKSWTVYFHDLPQSALLCDVWPHLPFRYRLFERAFAADAAAGTLPAYSFIEPRYFDDPGGLPPNDQHPPHDVTHGEALIAAVYNALRAGPGWSRTLLIVTYDEHGGCYDHVPPPAAVPPGGPTEDGFAFDRYGVRVPAVIVSPLIAAGSIIRPAGATPFDHCSILATLQRLYGLGEPLTPRVAAAPDLLPFLRPGEPDNPGPERIEPPPRKKRPRRAATPKLNHQQRALRRPAALAVHAAHLLARLHR